MEADKPSECKNSGAVLMATQVLSLIIAVHRVKISLGIFVLHNNYGYPYLKLNLIVRKAW